VTPRKRVATAAAVGSVCGVLLALRETKQWGYVVGYDMAAVTLIGTTLLVISALLLVARRTRRVGQWALLAVISLVLAFYIGIGAAKRLGAWDEPMISFGPEVPANLVVLFRNDATDTQIESFAENNISVPHQGGRGTDLLPGLQSLLKVQVGGHQGYALQFTRSASEEQRAEVGRRVRSAPITWRVFENVAPRNIVLPAV
jgi:hypothetical protein